MFKAFVLLAVLILTSFFVGCNKKSTEPIEEKTNTLLPLALGNTWNYKLYNQSSDSTGQVIWTINKKVIVDSKEYFLITSTGFGNSSFVANLETDGLFFSYYDSTNGFTSPFFFKYPANDNETYQYQMIGTDSILNITVKKQNLLIGNQNYSCYAYINQNFNPYFPFMYFAENVGLIRHKLVYNSVNGIDTTHYFIYDLQSKSLNN
ncbi:MAG: hypothetical protein Fur0015_06050 [Ignavibacteriales bacterium]